MKILMLSSVLPYPATTGGTTRVLNILKGLQRFHDVVFVAPARAGTDPTGAAAHTGARILGVPVSAPGKWRKVRALLGPRPYHATLSADPKVARAVHQLVSEEPFDLVYVDRLTSLVFLPEPIPGPVVVDQQHVDREMWSLRARTATRLPSRVAALWNGRRTARFEDHWLNKVAAYVSVSEADRNATLAYAGDRVRRVIVAPNGVDTDRFRPSARVRRDDVPVLGYLGAMDLDQNVDSVEYLYHEVLPRVVARVGPVRLLVIGKNPSPRVRSLSGTRGVDLMVTGTVSDVRSELEKVDVLTAPVLWGGGTKLKILEGMAVGLPVISNAHGVEGLAVEHREHVFQADDASTFADGIAELIRNPEQAAAMGRRGAELVRARYSWRQITSALSEELTAL